MEDIFGMFMVLPLCYPPHVYKIHTARCSGEIAAQNSCTAQSILAPGL